MHILYLTNGFPYPLTSGYLRHYFLIRELARRHTVTLLSLSKDPVAPESLAAMRPFTDHVFAFNGRSNWPGAARSARRALPEKIGRALGADSRLSRMRECAAELAGSSPYDVVLLSGKETFPVLQGLNGMPVVADMCDATSLRIRRSLRYAPASELPGLLVKYLQVVQAERQIIRRARRIVFASSRDRQAVLGPNGRASVIPNGVDLLYWTRRTPHRAGKAIAFTGAMHYPPNADAAHYLIEAILPRARRSLPDIELMIVGRDPTPALVESARRHPNVTVTGYVDDMRPFLERAAVFVAPLRYGAGIQNKALEAMAMEVPVVATPLVAEGLSVGAEAPPLWTAQAADEFATAAVQLLQDGRGERYVRQARRYVEDHFTWERSGEQLERTLASVIDEGTHGSA